MDYNFQEIEKKWQKEWEKNGTYKVLDEKLGFTAQNVYEQVLGLLR